MATEVDISIGVKLDKLRRTMAQIPEITTKEMNAAVAAASKAWRRQERAAKRASKAGVSSIKKVNDSIKKLGETMQGSFGGALGRVGSAVELFSELGASGGPVVLATAGVVALAAGFIAVEAALIGTVLAADDLIKEQKRLVDAGVFSPIDPETEESIRTVNGAVAGLTEVAKRLVITLATGVAPAIDDTSVSMLALALQAEDMFEKFVEGKNLLREFAVIVVDGLLNSALKTILLPITGVMKALTLLGNALILLGASDVGNALRSVEESFDDLTRGASEFIVDGVGAGLTEGFDGAAEGARDFNAEAQVLIATLTEGKEETKNTKTETKGLAAALRDAADAAKQLRIEADGVADANFDQFISLVDSLNAIDVGNSPIEALTPSEEAIAKFEMTRQALADINQELQILGLGGIDVTGQLDEVAAKTAALAESHASTMAGIREGAAADMEASTAAALASAAELGKENGRRMVDATLAIVANAGNIIAALAGKNKKAQQAAAIVNKAAAIAAIAVDTARATMTALTVAPPLGFVLAGAVVTAGVAAAATVAATPTSFHSGGVAPDEGLRMVQAGEGIISKQGMVAALNRGESGGGGQIVVTQVDHRVYDAQTTRAMNGNSPLRTAMIRASTHRGAYGRVRSK